MLLCMFKRARDSLTLSRAPVIDLRVSMTFQELGDLLVPIFDVEVQLWCTNHSQRVQESNAITADHLNSDRVPDILSGSQIGSVVLC